MGSGPNGLSAAITLARAGLKVKVFEAQTTIGGGARSAELTLPGFSHDLCSAVYPMAIVSPFFRSLPLETLGLSWIHSPSAVGHPLQHGRSVVLSNAGGLSAGCFRIEPGSSHGHCDNSPAEGLHHDLESWRRLFAPWLKIGTDLFADILAPFSFLPRHPLAMARFGMRGMFTADRLANDMFRTEEVKALFAGIVGHSMLALGQAFSAATGLALTLASHVGGWPIAAGGSQRISDALANYLRSLNGEIEVNAPISSLADLRDGARIVMLDISAKQFAAMCAEDLPAGYLRRVQNFRQGEAVFKIDWALSDPVPWESAPCNSAATIHVGGSYEEIADYERAVADGVIAERPFLILSQPSRFDPSRCPPGKHILWGYCHVPVGSTADMSERIEKQIERFAPGFRDCVLAKKITTPCEMEQRNANYAGGDITAGAMDWPQIFRRPARWFKPYKTPLDKVYLCSASTPPGPGVHGMCGFHAARLALAELD